MIRDAAETRDRSRVTAYADVQVAQNVQSRKIVSLVLDQLAVFLYGRRNLHHLEVSLGSTQSLFLIERHVLRSNGMNSGRTVERPFFRRNPSLVPAEAHGQSGTPYANTAIAECQRCCFTLDARQRRFFGGIF